MIPRPINLCTQFYIYFHIDYLLTLGAAAVEPSVTGEDEIEEHVEEKGNVKDILAHISSQIKEKDAQQGQKY